MFLSTAYQELAGGMGLSVTVQLTVRAFARLPGYVKDRFVIAQVQSIAANVTGVTILMASHVRVVRISVHGIHQAVLTACVVVPEAAVSAKRLVVTV